MASSMKKDAALIEATKDLEKFSKESNIPCYISEGADAVQIRAIHRMIATGTPFSMMSIPKWMQAHYLVRRWKMVIQVNAVKDGYVFHRHWPESLYLYPDTCKEGIPSLQNMTCLCVNSKKEWEEEEFNGCSYFTPKYTGDYTAEIPCFLIYGVALLNGKRYVHPNSFEYHGER